MLKKLFKESLVYGLSHYIGKFIGVFLLPLYTSILMPKDYGILDLLGTITLVSTFLIISGTDAATGYYYYRKEHLEERPIILSSSLWLRLIFSAAIFLIILFGSSILSNIIFGRDYKLFVIITGSTILFSSIFSFLNDLLRFEFRAWLFTIISTSNILIKILLAVYFVLILRQGVYGALMANMLADGVFFIVTIVYVFRRYGFLISTKWMKNILSYGFPLIGTGIAIWILNSTDRYFLAHYDGLASVGIYAVGMKMAAFIGMVSGALQMAWSPFSMDIQYREDAKKIYAKVFLLFMVINIIGVFFISMFSIDILKVFTQPEYYSAKAVIPFLCFSVILSSGYFIVVTGMHLTKKLRHTIWITLSSAAVNIVLNYFLTPVYGVLGASFSIMFANFVIFIVTLIISQNYYRIPFNYSQILITLIPSCIIIWFSYQYNIKLLPRIIITSVFAIGVSIYFYRIFRNSEEFEKIKEMIRKFKGKVKSEKPVDLDIET